ncbi:glycosyltransferase [Luteolibacter flavescens]|uniref:glycosyltransferase n=1 Tax=Luteolibacter flavescens TaxID=1859460 RepID=UPI0022214AB1|nr:glycosyltransferase [Luteolibacter flavescens]
MTDSAGRRAGGIHACLPLLARALATQGCGVTTFAIRDLADEDPASDWEPIPLHLFPPTGPRALGMSPGLVRHLTRSDADVLHTHGLWQGASLATHLASKRRGRPYVVSPHGMLDPWALAHSRWKKLVASALFERKHLVHAACIHALCESEARSIRSYGLRQPVAIIPNAVELPADPVGSPAPAPARALVFLGRLHPKKGLLSALDAWSKAYSTAGTTRGDRWQLVIAGWDQNRHEDDLKMHCAALGLPFASIPAATYLDPSHDFGDTGVVFVGPAFGPDKDRLLRRADAFILPSLSEGLPMAVLEAWAYGLPVLMTEHCNLPEGFIAEAAIRIGTDSHSIAAGLADLFAGSGDALRSMGSNGRRLVEERFTWDRVAGQMRQVYEWILGGGAAPAFLHDP